MKFDNKTLNSVFVMPTEVEKYLKEANLAEMKVLVYLFSRGLRVDSSEKIASDLGLCENEVLKALSFWRGARILSGRESDFSNIETVSDTSKSERKIEYTSGEIADAIESDGVFSSLLDFSQKRLEKIFSPSEQGILYSLIDADGFPCDYIMGVIEYCASIGKKSLRYIEKTAQKIYEDGIDTYEKLEIYISEKEKLKSFEGIVRKVTGIGTRAFTKSESKHVEQWKNDGVDEDMLSYAYERTVNNTGKASIAYMAKIIEKWKSDGVKTSKDLDDVKEYSGGEIYSLDDFAEKPGE